MTTARDLLRRTGANLSRTARRLVARGVLPPRSGCWLRLRVGPLLDEQPPPRLPWSTQEGLSLLEALSSLDFAAGDPRVDGVLLRIEGPLGWSVLLSLRRAVEALRERGTPVAVYAERLDAAGLLLASAADRVWLPESGQLLLVGLRLEGFYLRGLLEKLHLRPEVIRIGTHKSAAERFTRDSMSSEEREQLEALADTWFSELVGGIARGRGLSERAVRDLIDRGPYSARAAVEAGLVDGCLYPDEIESQLERLAPEPPEERPGPRRVRWVEAPVYHALWASDPGWRPLLRGLPRVAYVVARGMIHGGRGPRGIASDSVHELLERLRCEDEVRAVVLRLDSPGGEPLASDLLWHQIRRVGREKPVVVSMAEVAASGGYYLAAAADRVFAEAATVTGSIGVVGGKLNLEEVYRRIGVGRDAVERGERAGMLSEARGFTPDERKALRDEFAAAYALFVDRVAQGRELAVEAVDRLGQGRIYSGARAREIGLVDALGGPLEALAEARRLAGLAPEERILLEALPRHAALPPLRVLARLAALWALRG